MKRFLFLLCCFVVFSIKTAAQSTTALTVQEADGSPIKYGVTKLILPNGSLTISGSTATFSGSGAISGPSTITDNSAACFSVGPNGATNPVFQVVCNVASQATGVSVTGRAAGAGVDLTVLSSGSNENLLIAPKGTGGVAIGGTSPTIFTASGSGKNLTIFSDSGNITLGNASLGVSATTHLGIASNADIVFSNTSQDYTATADLRMVRHASGVLRLDNSSSSSGSILIGPSGGSIGTSGVGVLAMFSGTAPSTSPADEFQLYAGDGAAGAAEAYIRNEAGEINRLTGLAARNSAQFDVTSSTTLVNVTGLTRNVEAGRTYGFRAYLQTTANVAGGVKFAVAGTATATAISYEGVLEAAAALVAQTRATALATTVCASTTTTAGTCEIQGVIQVANAGTLTIQFAQNASTGTASSVLANQYFQVFPIS